LALLIEPKSRHFDQVDGWMDGGRGGEVEAAESCWGSPARPSLLSVTKWPEGFV